MYSQKVYQNSEQSNSTKHDQRDQALCRKLLPALREGAESDDCQVSRLALDVVIHALVEHTEAIA